MKVQAINHMLSTIMVCLDGLPRENLILTSLLLTRETKEELFRTFQQKYVVPRVKHRGGGVMI